MKEISNKRSLGDLLGLKNIDYKSVFHDGKSGHQI